MIIDFATGKVKKPAPPETATPVSSPEPKKPYTPAKRKPASLPVENRRAELAKIHVAKKQLAMDDETYRAMLMSQFGVESARDLSAHQRKSCILYMAAARIRGQARQGVPAAHRRAPKTPGRAADAGKGRLRPRARRLHA